MADMSDGVPKWVAVVGVVVGVGMPLATLFNSYATLDVARRTAETSIQELKAQNSQLSGKVEQLTIQVAGLQYQLEQVSDGMRELKQQRR